LPSSFEVIAGAREGEAKAIVRGRGLNLFLIGSDAIMAVSSNDRKKMNIVGMRVLGGNSKSNAIGIGRLGERSNYLIGDDPRIGALASRTLNASYYPVCIPESI
jgi:hypothetical protein